MFVFVTHMPLNFYVMYTFRAKELGPEGESKEKKVIDLDYQNDCNEEDEHEISLSNSQSQYQNAELAMLCPTAVSYQIENTHIQQGSLWYNI